MLTRFRVGWLGSVIWLACAQLSVAVVAQQQADAGFQPTVVAPAYPHGHGPRVLIDEAHSNYHTAGGRYAAFARLLRLDGFRVSPSSLPFSRQSLANAEILVIANALHESNRNAWVLPTPSAFEPGEINVLNQWIRAGGRLLLIADHMPFPGAAETLARELGFELGNGYARGPAQGIFRRRDGLLKPHPILDGRNPAEAITAVRTFTGQAFQADPDARALIVFGPGHEMRLPRRAGRFDDQTKRVAIRGWYHAATRRWGAGRVVVLGEAALFSAQISGSAKRPMGFNAPGAEQNQQFCLNAMRWLSGLLEPDPTPP